MELESVGREWANTYMSTRGTEEPEAEARCGTEHINWLFLFHFLFWTNILSFSFLQCCITTTPPRSCSWGGVISAEIMRVATVPYCHRAHFLQNILRFTSAECYCCSHSSSYSCILDKIYHQVILCLTLISPFFWRCFESFRGICLLFFFFPSSFVGVKAGKTDVQWTW